MKGEHYAERTRSTGTVVFYSIYFVLLAAALSAAVVGLGKLWEFLQHYEACQIYHTIDAVAEELNSGNLGLLYSGIEGEISPYEGEGAARRQLSERFTGEFTLKKNIKESTKENPVYTVLCGGEPAAFARLAQTGADEPLRIRDIRRGAGLRRSAGAERERKAEPSDGLHGENKRRGAVKLVGARNG